LNLRWDLSQLHCAKAAESVLLLLRQDDVVVPIVGYTLTVCFFAIFCQPFVVFCQRDVALLQLPKFSGFGRRSRRFQQLCVLCRFRTILLGREHQASPFLLGESSAGLSVIRSHNKMIINKCRYEEVSLRELAPAFEPTYSSFPYVVNDQ